MLRYFIMLGRLLSVCYCPAGNSFSRSSFKMAVARCMVAHPGEKLYLADLAAAMGLRVTELSKGIEKLQDSGFVTWKTDREAGRTYVELSSKAVELMAEERDFMKRCYARLRTELGDDELRRAVDIMQKVTAVLQEEREKNS